VHDLRLDLGAVLVHDVDQCTVGVDGRVGSQVQRARRLGWRWSIPVAPTVISPTPPLARAAK